MPESTNPTEEKDSFELCEWPDALIRAVAQEAPELFRSDDPFAVRDEDMLAYARSLATICLEESDLGYVDLEAYAEDEKASDFFRRFEVEGQIWHVATWAGSETLVPDLPRKAETPGLYAWPDELVAAAGREAPALLRYRHDGPWAVQDEEFARFAHYWLFEGYCDARLYRHVDLERYIAERKAEFIALETPAGLWHVRAGDEGAQEAEPATGDELSLLEWPDALLAAVASALPEALKDGDNESLSAVADDRLFAVLSQWADGHEEEVAETGGLATWVAMVRDEDFRPVSVSGERWWIHSEVFKPAKAAASAA